MPSWRDNSRVAVARSTAARYPADPPFHPPARFPELGFLPAFDADAGNCAYTAVRDALALLYGEPDGPGWNPLGSLVSPGDTVVLKPNFIKEHHEYRRDEWQQVITHGAVIRAVCDYVVKALDGRGRIVVCDAPQTDSSFVEICRVSGVTALCQWYRSWCPVQVDLVDLRNEEWTARDDVIVERRALPGDPDGCVAVNLGQASLFHGITPVHGFYGADYADEITQSHHQGDIHEYLLSGTAMRADVVINLPKLKTHKKTGITCALKNFVGVNGDKNWLPHYMLGAPEEGGDQFPARSIRTSSERALMTWFKRRLYHAPTWVNHLFRPLKRVGKLVFGTTDAVVRSGNWHGNDTTWRMALDLNACFFYWRDGRLDQSHTRRYLCLVDGIIGGEGEGPLAPDAVPCGIIVAGENPVAVDTAVAWLMGFDWRKLRLVAGAYARTQYPLASFEPSEVELVSTADQWTGPLAGLDPGTTFHFTPHFGWVGAIERNEACGTCGRAGTRDHR